MSRARTDRRSVDVWPALSDTILAFLLTIILFLAFLIASFIRIDRGPQEPPRYEKDQEKVSQIVTQVRKEHGSVSLPKDRGNAQEITLGNEVLFPSGSAKLSADGKRLMTDLIDRIAGADLPTLREIVVKGHTDKEPVVRGKFPTNWELSTARASRVVRALIRSEQGKQRIDPNEVTLVASGYSKYQPVDPDDQAENRRIELRLIYAADENGENGNWGE
ncbi:MAG: flagellar motor protein MotB [Salinibacter sp.]